MRFANLQGHLSNPVLRQQKEESDYTGESFKTSIELISPFELEIEKEVVQGDLLELIRQKKASFALQIHARATYYYELIGLSKGPRDTVKLDKDAMMGSVYATVILRATENCDFSSADLRGGLANLSFRLRPGDPLAIGDEKKLPYRQSTKMLGPSFFKLNESPQLPDWEYLPEFTDDHIEIKVGQALNHKLQRNMKTELGRAQNIALVYLPVLVEFLNAAKEEDFSSCGWFEAVRSAAQNKGADLEDTESPWDSIKLAQQLLDYPHSKLLKEEG